MQYLSRLLIGGAFRELRLYGREQRVIPMIRGKRLLSGILEGPCLLNPILIVFVCVRAGSCTTKARQ